MMNINSLPSLIFRIIFSKLPPEDFVRLGQVCQLWKAEQATVATKYDTLTLLIGSNAGDLITKSCFTVNHRDKLMNDDGTRMYPQQQYSFRLELSFLESIADLPQLFLNITNLEIAARNVEATKAIPQILDLLLNWAPQLQCLKMWFDFQVSHSASNSQNNQKFLPQKENSLIHSILNQLPVLERFTLDLGDQTCYPLEYGMDWPMLSRLSEFRVNFKDSDKLLDESLKLYCSEDELLFSLSKFGFVKSGEGYQIEFRAEFENLLPNIEMLHLTGIAKSIGFDQFDILTTLRLSFGYNPSIEPLSSIINPLTNLSQLKFLTFLNLRTEYSSQDNQNLLLPLKSVLVLKLIKITVKKHTELESIPWGHTFPAVQVIEAFFHSNDGYLGMQSPVGSFLTTPYLMNRHITKEQIELNVAQLVELICAQCIKLRRFYEYHLNSSFKLILPEKVDGKKWIINEYCIKNDPYEQRTIQKSRSFENLAQMYQ